MRQIVLDSLPADPGWEMDPEALAVFCAAARVMLDKFHEPPRVGQVVSPEGTRQVRIEWSRASARAGRTHAHSDDATRDGAYALAFAVLRQLRSYTFLRRAERRSGADFVLVREGAAERDFIMLEVSGVGRGSDAVVNGRLRDKVRQVSRHDGEAIAVVVRFQRPLVAIEEASHGHP